MVKSIFLGWHQEFVRRFSGRYSCLLAEGTGCFLLKVNEVFSSGETCVDCVNVCFLDPWCLGPMVPNTAWLRLVS